MLYLSRSARVVGTHLFAKFGYDEALRHISHQASTQNEAHFWKEVLVVVEELQANELEGLHPCAALPTDGMVAKRLSNEDKPVCH